MIGDLFGVLLKNSFPDLFRRSPARFPHLSPFRDTEAGLEGAPPSPLMISQQLSDRNDCNLDSEPEMGSAAAKSGIY